MKVEEEVIVVLQEELFVDYEASSSKMSESEEYRPEYRVTDQFPYDPG